MTERLVLDVIESLGQKRNGMTKQQELNIEQLEQLGMVIPDVGFEDAIAEFELADAEKHPAPGSILFYGDSDIRVWLQEDQFTKDFAEMPVVNRGFGGAQIWETILYFKRVVLPHKPSVIVYNCGDNDVCKLSRLDEDGPRNVEIGFRVFLELVEKYLPELKQLIYLGIHPAPKRNDDGLWPVQDEANKRVEKICAEYPWAVYEDYNHMLYSDDGELRNKDFLDDRVHFSPLFYERLGMRVREMIAMV